MKQSSDDARAERLTKLCAIINKSSFGGDNKDAVTWLGSRDTISIERFSSGCPGLDEALGGGWPKGRFIEVFGPESGGKTTLVLHAVAEHQAKYPDEDCALIDTEFSFDEDYAKKLGVDTKYLVVHQPEAGEQALNILKLLIQNGVKCIIVDSVAALTTRNELEGDIGDTHVGEQARLMSQALRQLTAEAGKRGATVFWTNQMREKIGVMYGDKTTTPAGRALKHYASIRLHIRAIGKVKEKIRGEDVIVSSRNKIDVKKNKVAPPFRTAEFCISFGHGIDIVADVLDTAIAMKIVVKRGAWFSWNGEQLGCGRAVSLELLRSNPDMTRKITEMIAEAKAAGVKPEVAEDVEQQDPNAGADPDALGSVEAEIDVQDV
jgi:recombination protein RecA